MLHIEALESIRRVQDPAIADVLGSLELPLSRLGEADLAEVVLAVSRHPGLYEDLTVDDRVDRWWMPLHAASNFEVRIQAWHRDQASDWHDHGGSSGAFAVLTGTLLERFRSPDGASVMERRVAPQQHSAFGASHIHDVTHLDGEPALSIHAYSPPLTRLTYYEHTRLGFVAQAVVMEESHPWLEAALV
jgi:hypothetical protein